VEIKTNGDGELWKGRSMKRNAKSDEGQEVKALVMFKYKQVS